jgi:hypothetical protein
MAFFAVCFHELSRLCGTDGELMVLPLGQHPGVIDGGDNGNLDPSSADSPVATVQGLADRASTLLATLAGHADDLPPLASTRLLAALAQVCGHLAGLVGMTECVLGDGGDGDGDGGDDVETKEDQASRPAPGLQREPDTHDVPANGVYPMLGEPC